MCTSLCDLADVRVPRRFNLANCLLTRTEDTWKIGDDASVRDFFYFFLFLLFLFLDLTDGGSVWRRQPSYSMLP